MVQNIFTEIHRGLPREGRSKYTRRAFKMLPIMDRPNILDIGCGPGIPTIELAKLSNGNVIGMDINQPYLDELMEKAKGSNLSNRVTILNRSMFKMDFPDESFDLIWSEGSIFLIGFERGLKEWKRYIKPNRFLVVHDMSWLRPNPPQEIRDYWKKVYPEIKTIKENLNIISSSGYLILGHFALPEDAWWDEYYGPLEERIQDFREKYKDDPKSLAQLNKEQEEIDLYCKYSKWYGSAFFIMQRFD